MFLGIRLTSWRLLENTIHFSTFVKNTIGDDGMVNLSMFLWHFLTRLQFLGSSIGFFYNFDTFLEFQHLEFSLLKIKRSETELESLTWMFTYIFHATMHATQTFAEICTWLVPSATEKTTSEIFWRPRHATFFEEF